MSSLKCPTEYTIYRCYAPGRIITLVARTMGGVVSATHYKEVQISLVSLKWTVPERNHYSLFVIAERSTSY